MPYKELRIGEVDTSIIYVSRSEFMKRTGLSKSSVHYHITKGELQAIRFNHKTFFTPEVAEQYEKLAKCGLIGSGDKDA